jgi:NADP-dependent 3-hydroxy acid dehydrogenase YdfG
MREQGTLKPNFDRILQPEDVAHTVVEALRLPRRAMVSELDVRPSNP